MPRNTGLQQRRQKYQRNSELAKAGICIQCETLPVTTNQDGTTSVRCAECKAKRPLRNRVRKLNSATPVKLGRPVGEWGIDEDHGFIDKQEFREYCVTVAKVIKKGATSIGDHKRALGDDFSERMHMDALESLISAGEITERVSGSFTRYETFTAPRRAVKTLPWNNTNGPALRPKCPTPWGHLEDTRRRVLA